MRKSFTTELTMRKLLLWSWGSPVSGHGPSARLIKTARFPSCPPGLSSADEPEAPARVSSGGREGASLRSCSSHSTVSQRQRGRGRGPGASRREPAWPEAGRGARPQRGRQCPPRLQGPMAGEVRRPGPCAIA